METHIRTKEKIIIISFTQTSKKLNNLQKPSTNFMKDNLNRAKSRVGLVVEVGGATMSMSDLI